MPEMGVSMLAANLGTNHKEAVIFFFHDVVGLKGSGIAWPAGARVKFGLRGKQRFAAADAGVPGIRMNVAGISPAKMAVKLTPMIIASPAFGSR